MVTSGRVVAYAFGTDVSVVAVDDLTLGSNGYAVLPVLAVDDVAVCADLSIVAFGTGRTYAVGVDTDVPFEPELLHLPCAERFALLAVVPFVAQRFGASPVDALALLVSVSKQFSSSEVVFR